MSNGAWFECFRCNGLMLKGYTNDQRHIFCRRCYRIVLYILEDTNTWLPFCQVWLPL